LSIITAFEECDNGIETAYLGKCVKEIGHLSEHNILPVLNYVLDDIVIYLLFIAAVSLLKIHMNEGVCDGFVSKWYLCLVIQQVVLHASTAASENLFHDVHDLIGALEDGNVLIDKEEIGINSDLLVLLYKG